MSQDVGGDFVTKVKVRSGWMVMNTGVGVPGAMCDVRAVVRKNSQCRESDEDALCSSKLDSRCRALRRTIELLAKVHRFDSTRTKRRPDRWTCCSLAGGNDQAASRQPSRKGQPSFAEQKNGRKGAPYRTTCAAAAATFDMIVRREKGEDKKLAEDAKRFEPSRSELMLRVSARNCL